MAKKSDQTGFSRIYAAFLSLCRPAELPPPWDGLTPHSDCFLCPTDPDAAFAELQEQFDRRDLLRSHVAVRTRDNGVRLRRSLRDPAEYVVALRKKEGAAPFDVLTAEGCLSQTRWPAIASLEDLSIRAALADSDNRLLVCFDMLELVVCRSIGLPASLAVGLDDESLDLLDELALLCGWNTRDRDYYLNRLTDEQLEAEEARYEALEARLADSMAAADAAARALDEPPQDDVEDQQECSGAQSSEVEGLEVGDSAAAAVQDVSDDSAADKRAAPSSVKKENDSPIHELTILGWRFPAMSTEEPAELMPLIDYLRDVDQYLGIDLEVGIWTPKAASIRLIEKRLEHGVIPGAVDAVRDSYEQEGWSLQRYGHPPRRPPSNFAEAVARLREVFRGEGSQLAPYEERVKEAMVWFERHLDLDVVVPMLNEAATASDPVRKSNLLVAAELGRMLHREAAAVDQCMQRAVATAVENHTAPAELPNMKCLLALVDRLMGVSRELSR
ncbi:MAG: hypothetical protein H8E66_25350 [Planctomycetes bacterium]|nr:hypothetical protein [Planctomycetota bacterium]